MYKAVRRLLRRNFLSINLTTAYSYLTGLLPESLFPVVSSPLLFPAISIHLSRPILLSRSVTRRSTVCPLFCPHQGVEDGSYYRRQKRREYDNQARNRSEPFRCN